MESTVNSQLYSTKAVCEPVRIQFSVELLERMMAYTISSALLIIINLISIKLSTNECIQSHTTICDTVQDFLMENDGTWTDVVITSDKNPPPPQVAFEFIDFRKLTSLTIVGQINKISTELVSLCFHETNMKFLSLYGNKLKKIKSDSFSKKLKLQKLNLINNQIEEIEAGTFEETRFEVIDLSNNLLETVVSQTFTGAKSKNYTKSIIIRNNKLAWIEPDSFPVSLKILKLDNNVLRAFLDGVIDKLVKLRGLFLSNNRFSTVPNITELKELIVLDLSHNNINMIERTAFRNIKNLQTLDLSYNKLKKCDFLKPLLLRNNFLDVSLAFNHLNDLKLGVNKNASLEFNSLILFGNPWWCHKWISIQNFLNQTQMKQTECDLVYFNSGKFPFCISFQGLPNYFPNASGIQSYDVLNGPKLEITDEELESFLGAIEPKLDSVNCQLSVRKKPDENVLFSDTVRCVSPGLVFVSAFD